VLALAATLAAAALVLGACADARPTETTDPATDSGGRRDQGRRDLGPDDPTPDQPTEVAEDPDATDVVEDVAADPDGTVADAVSEIGDVVGEPDLDAAVPFGFCRYRSSTFGIGFKEVDTVDRDDPEVTFVVAGLPPVRRVSSAILAYVAEDADSGSEGWIRINGNEERLIPIARAPGDPRDEHPFRVTLRPPETWLVGGTNRVSFVAFDSPTGRQFRISDVELLLEARDGGCTTWEPNRDAGGDTADGATGEGVERTLTYRDAVYEGRNNWVLDCPGDYAFTSADPAHAACDESYAPDGSTHGAATFTFEDVAADRYDVFVQSRHTPSRNPLGTLVTVDGHSARLPQNDDADLVWDHHGEYALEGTVEVVVDSRNEVASDSVRAVRLTPR
jgi:hypothetical protein